MSNDYVNDRLLYHDNDEGFSKVVRASTNFMGRLRTLPLHIRIERFIRTRSISSIFGISCLLPMIICTCILIYNIGYIIAFFSYFITILFGSDSFDSRNAFRETPTRRGLTIFDKRIRYRDYNYLNADTLTYENRTYEDDLQILFRFPQKRKSSGVLLIFHGCSRSAYDWFHTIERQRIIGAAIDLGYACLAFQAYDRSSRCWTNDVDLYSNVDAQRVLKALDYFYKEYPQLGKIQL